MNWSAKWIKPAIYTGKAAPVFSKKFSLRKEVQKAVLHITALGVYEATINGARVGQFVLAPGWTSYKKRLQYQSYDVTGMLQAENAIEVIVGKGWYSTPMPGNWALIPEPPEEPVGLFAQLEITYTDGTADQIITDECWNATRSRVCYSEIYNGETYDATYVPGEGEPVATFNGPTHTLIPQEGEEVREQERLGVAAIIRTPKGETVIDFGQEVTGYVEIALEAKAGEVVRLSHGEVLDKEGNFYNANYRKAKAEYRYICKDGYQAYKPKLTFFGFRYIRVEEFPGGPEQVRPENFKAIVVHSNMKRTGWFNCSNLLLNRLFENVRWGQKGNFVDVPTDCPQRDERMGWTGDAQVFIRTACMNFDAEKFYIKWLGDLLADQEEDGYIPPVIPNLRQTRKASAAWSDAITICPWEIYKSFANRDILVKMYPGMKKWIQYVTDNTEDTYLWTGGNHYGDWLGLDAPSGSYKGSTRDDFVASAFYAYSTFLVIKVGKLLGEDVSEFEQLYENIVRTFRKAYPVYHTQTECVLAAHFGLAEDCQATADQLAKMIIDSGVQLRTGFVGTPYLLHVLSNYGYTELAYSLLLREEYPSWLYQVKKGATTMWEHWDGIMENNDFWSDDMNSFNHYAYGCVMDWVYSQAAGINPIEEAPGYEKIRIAPHPDARLDWMEARLDTRQGKVHSVWKKQDGYWRYEITTPVAAEVVIDGCTHQVQPGKHLFYSKIM